MRVEKNALISGAKKVGISQVDAEKLWAELKDQPSVSKFDFSHLLYYLGAMLVIAAMTLYIGNIWDKMGGKELFLFSASYMVVFFFLGRSFWNRPNLKAPGGLFITLSVCMIPLVVYSLQRWSGLWLTDREEGYTGFFGWVSGEWFLMEIATLVGGSIAFYFYRFSFLTLPIFFTLWFMSMDVVPLLFSDFEGVREKVSIVFGIGMLIAAYIIDLNTKEDLAYWPYIFGVIAFWGGLSLLDSTSEYTRFLYLLINVGLVFISIILQRVVFLLFGAVGILIYISSIFYAYFLNSLNFPLILSLIGCSLLFLGVLYHKNRAKIETSIMGLFPASAKKWLPRR